MFLIDDLVLSPAKAVCFLFQSLAKTAQEELLDDEPLKQELRETYGLLDSGRITEEEFTHRESRIVQRLEEIYRLKCQLLGVSSEGDLSSAEPRD